MLLNIWINAGDFTKVTLRKEGSKRLVVIEKSDNKRLRGKDTETDETDVIDQANVSMQRVSHLNGSSIEYLRPDLHTHSLYQVFMFLEKIKMIVFINKFKQMLRGLNNQRQIYVLNTTCCN